MKGLYQLAALLLAPFAFLPTVVFPGPQPAYGTIPAPADEPVKRPNTGEPTTWNAWAMSIARDAEPAQAWLSQSSAYQGGAVLLIVSGATSANVSFLGASIDLEPVAGSLRAYLGVGTLVSPGAEAMTVEVIDRTGAPETFNLEVTVLETNWTVDFIVLPPGVGSGLTPEIVQAESDRLAAIYSGATPPAWTGTWQWPVANDTRITGYFGEQRSFNGGTPTGHHGGTDFGSGFLDPIWPTNGGTVVLAEELAVRGNTVIVDHGGGIFTGHSHLESVAVAVGQTVTTSDIIGFVGTTGLSTGYHLHWEFSVHGVLVDGLRWLDGTQGF